MSPESIFLPLNKCIFSEIEKEKIAKCINQVLVALEKLDDASRDAELRNDPIETSYWASTNIVECKNFLKAIECCGIRPNINYKRTNDGHCDVEESCLSLSLDIYNMA